MSGGFFDYQQHRIEDIADSIEQVIASPEDWDFTPETIEEFRKGVVLLRRAAVYAQRIDYLLSGDDGEESFHRRLAEELAKEEEREV